jgi:NhaP-type Na+/H+ or K+/H+ antiporter
MLALPTCRLPILLTLYGVRNGLAWGSEFYWTILYQVLVTGAVAFGIGCAAARLLRLAEKVGSMDRDTYLIFPVALSFMLLCVGVLMGGSEVIAVFIGGTGFVFAAHEDHAFEAADTQDLLDTLTTFTSFFVFGLIIPWVSLSSVGASKPGLCDFTHLWK